MNNEDFCKMVSAYEGEEISDIKQIQLRSFNGEELKEFVEYCIENNNSDLGDAIKRFSYLQEVYWKGLNYWVIEDNGEDRVLVANADRKSHPEYNDWWVNRDELNLL